MLDLRPECAYNNPHKSKDRETYCSQSIFTESLRRWEGGKVQGKNSSR